MQEHMPNFIHFCDFVIILEPFFHTTVRNFRFCKDITDGLETKMLVERGRLCLGMETQFGSALALRLDDDLLHKIFGKALIAFDG